MSGGGNGSAVKVVGTDPGPMARFAAVTANPSTPGIIVQRVADGESLKEISKAWGLPYKRFLAWIAANGDLTEQCKRVRELAGIELRMEGLEIVDDATPETAPVAKLQADYREKLSRDLNRPLFGKFTQHKHEHSFDLGEVLRRAKEREKVIEHSPDTVTVEPIVPAAPDKPEHGLI